MRVCKIKNTGIKTKSNKNVSSLINLSSKQAIQNGIDNLNVTQARGVIEGLKKSFGLFLDTMDFHCTGTNKQYLSKLRVYTDKFLAEIYKRNLMIDLNFMVLECKKLYDIEEQEEKKRAESSSEEKLKLKDIGIPKSIAEYFLFLDVTYEIIEKLLLIHQYRLAETKCLKYIRTYLLKMIEFFNSEVESDLKNRESVKNNGKII